MKYTLLVATATATSLNTEFDFGAFADALNDVNEESAANYTAMEEAA